MRALEWTSHFHDAAGTPWARMWVYSEYHVCFQSCTPLPWAIQDNLWNVERTLPWWSWDHATLTIAFSAWLLGLAGLSETLGEPALDPAPNAGTYRATPEPGKRISRISPCGADAQVSARIAAHLFLAALAIWLVVLADELAVIPPVVRRFALHAGASVGLIGGTLFGFGLVAGYFAIAWVWLGVGWMDGGWSCAKQSGSSRGDWLSWWRLLGNVSGVVGVTVMLCKPNTPVRVLVVTSGIPYLWTITFAWQQMRRPICATQHEEA